MTTKKTPKFVTRAVDDLIPYVNNARTHSVIHAPSCVKISAMGWKDYRIHHNVIWNNTTPLIINERHKKPNRLMV